MSSLFTQVRTAINTSSSTLNQAFKKHRLFLGVRVMVFNITFNNFNYIVALSFIGGFFWWNWEYKYKTDYGRKCH